MAFRASTRLLAASIQGLSPSQTSELAKELLPPLILYRRLLRVHRKVLPPELRIMGDDYVKPPLHPPLPPDPSLSTRPLVHPQSEFRRTRSTDNPLHIVGFLSEWKKYLDHHEALANGAKGAELEKEVGQKLDPSILETLSADQIGQLYELFQASQDVWLSPEELEAKLAAEGKTEEGIPAGQVLPDLGKSRLGGGEGEGR